MKTLELFLKEKGIYVIFAKNLIADPRSGINTKNRAKNWIENAGGEEDSIILAFRWDTAKYPEHENTFKYWSTIDTEYSHYLES